MHDIVADLEASVDNRRVALEAEVPKSPADLLRTTRADAVLFSPRSFERLTDEERADPRARRLRYVVDPVDLQRVGNQHGWRRLTAAVA